MSFAPDAVLRLVVTWVVTTKFCSHELQPSHVCDDALILRWSRLVSAGQFEGRPFRFRCFGDALSPKSSAVAKGTDLPPLLRSLALVGQPQCSKACGGRLHDCCQDVSNQRMYQHALRSLQGRVTRQQHAQQRQMWAQSRCWLLRCRLRGSLR